MAGTYDATVNAFYLAYYGRPADPAGLAYWSNALTASGGKFDAIVDAFSTSTEATAHFSSSSPTDHVSAIYQQLFGRAPDKAGLAYWTAAIGSGSVSLADAAIQIMGGAQSSDAQVAALRQDAAAQFTASVAASGVAYDGTAAVEAARVLIAAVTPTSSASDIKALVTASASLVQTVHDNPTILTALASSGDLTKLLTTTTGHTDPVGMVQALASIGKAAATDSAGLATLLKGGGVAGLIGSLPAGTTLQDVTKAVDTGGLAAGTVVATPPVASTPVITPKIAFVGADGHDLPLSTTLVANSIWYFIDIQGRPANTTVSFEVSATGKDGWKTVLEDAPLDDGTYFVHYKFTDAAGNSSTSNTLKLVMDHTLASPTVQLSHDTGTTAVDGITSNGEVTVSGLRANEAWTYSFNGTTWITGTADANGVGTISDTAADGVRHLTVRTLETVPDGTGFTSTAMTYTVDTIAPAQGLKLASTTHTDATHADVVFSYTGDFAFNQGAGLFYRIDSNVWNRADNTVVDEVNKTVTFKNVDLSHGDAHIVIQTVDTAGNLLDLTTTIAGTPDTTAPAAPVVALVNDTGASATDHVTSDGTIKVTGLETGATWQYSLDNGANWYTGGTGDQQGTSTLPLSLSGQHTLLVHTTDMAGNVSTDTTFTYTVDTSPSVLLNVAGHAGSNVTVNSAGLVFQTMVSGDHNGLTTTYEVSTTGNVADFHAWTPDQHLDDGTYYFRANVLDLAGNTAVSAAVAVHLDNTPPAGPTSVQLERDSGIDGDGITNDGTFIVNGLEQGSTWEYSSDGTNWYQGNLPDADGKATGFAQATGEQTLQVRTYDAAGNHSAVTSLHFTLDQHNPADGLAIFRVEDGGAGDPANTSLYSATVVFSYTGTIDAGDVLQYNLDNANNAAWTKIDGNMIDTDAKTITISGIDIAHADPYITINGTSVAGANWSFQHYIDGPSTNYDVQQTSTGLQVRAYQEAHLYLNDGANAPVQITTDADSGNTVYGTYVQIGAQANVVHGHLGAGNDAQTQTINNKLDTYVFGTNSAQGDTLSGNYVWGFDGDDKITVVAGAGNDGEPLASGGAGSDQIDSGSVSSWMLYAAHDSSIIAGTAAAHGFDTVNLVGDGQNTYYNGFQFDLTGSIENYAAVTGTPLQGNESGDALLSMLNVAASSKLSAGHINAALIDAGPGINGEVNFLVVDADKDGAIGANDYVVKIVGSISQNSISDYAIEFSIPALVA